MRGDTGGAMHSLEHHGQRQHPSRRATVLLATRRRAKLDSRHIGSSDRNRCHRRLPERSQEDIDSDF